MDDVQGLAKEWSLGCVKRAPAARGSQDAGITQPRDRSLADPCTYGVKGNAEMREGGCGRKEGLLLLLRECGTTEEFGCIFPRAVIE